MTLSGALVNGLANAAATALVSIGIGLNALYRPKGRGSTPPLRCHCEPVRRLVAAIRPPSDAKSRPSGNAGGPLHSVKYPYL